MSCEFQVAAVVNEAPNAKFIMNKLTRERVVPIISAREPTFLTTISPADRSLSLSPKLSQR